MYASEIRAGDTIRIGTQLDVPVIVAETRGSRVRLIIRRNGKLTTRYYDATKAIQVTGHVFERES
jgi:hypothetical protein